MIDPHHLMEIFSAALITKKQRDDGKLEVDLKPLVTKVIWAGVVIAGVTIVSTHDNTNQIAMTQKTVSEFIAYQAKKDDKQDQDRQDMHKEDIHEFNRLGDKIDKVWQAIKR